MYAGIHMEMAFKVLEDYSNPKLLQFLIENTAKPGANISAGTREKWLKEWMDMPDDSKHGSKIKNDHSYKLEKTERGFKIKFGKSADLGTVIARLKYAARDINEWAIEDEGRTCALEFLKSIHWVIDFSSPSHTCAEWDDKQHSRSEEDFDEKWQEYYVKIKSPKEKIEDVYRWAKRFVEARYDRNLKLCQIYKNKGSIKNDGEKIGREVIRDVAQNLVDYFAYMENKKAFSKLLK